MKILGIDSSGLVASAAIADEKNIIAEFTVNNKQTHSQTLLPMIEKVVDMSGIELEQIDAIAIAAGPGSFTGLRIGSATAKGIGLALKKPIVSVPTLEGLAYRVSVFDGLTCLAEQKAVDIHDILKELEEYDEKVIFLGDGVEVHRETIENELKNEFVFAPVHLSKQSAAAVAVLGSIYFEQGKAESADEHKPIYLRKSQAEREREERLKNQG